MLTKMPSHFDLKLIDMGERIAGKQDRPSLNAYNNFYFSNGSIPSFNRLAY